MTKIQKKIDSIDSMIRINRVIVIIAIISAVYFYLQYKSQEKNYLIRYPGGFASMHGAKPTKIKITNENRNEYKKAIEYAKKEYF